MQLEIGGGTKQLGQPWQNMDRIKSADIVHDLEDFPWPLAADSVSQVYSSHCLEHLAASPIAILNELARVCRIGATLELRMPTPGSHLENVHDHKQTWSVISLRNIDEFFPREVWTGPKRLKLLRWHIEPSILWEPFAPRIKRRLPGFTDQELMLLFPMLSHETRFYLECRENDCL